MAAHVPFALIVEDSSDIAGLMQAALAHHGLETAHARDGFAALDLLEQRLPDVMLLDLNMPGMSGWEVLEAIKERYPDFAVPVIVLTALNDPANRLIGKLQAHVFRYLTKPFEIETLAQTVREALRGPQPGEGSTA